MARSVCICSPPPTQPPGGEILGGRKVGNGLAQKDFNGAQLSHSKAYFTESALLKPIGKLTGSDFFPNIIGMEEHFAFGHLFCLLHVYSTG
jgi:hypothetical protein